MPCYGLALRSPSSGADEWRLFFNFLVDSLLRRRRRRSLIESLCMFPGAKNREKSRLYVCSILKRHNSILTSQYCLSCQRRAFTFLSARNREKRLYVGSMLKRHNSVLTFQYCPSCPARAFRIVPRSFASKTTRQG